MVIITHLPKILDGNAVLIENVLPEEDARVFLYYLLTGVDWEQQQINVYGLKNIPRLTKNWSLDGDVTYTYSKKKFKTEVIPDTINWIRESCLLYRSDVVIPDYSRSHGVETFNYCLGNLYQDGRDYISYHADDEPEILGMVAGMSFGAERDMLFRNKRTREVTTIVIPHNSLLVMFPNCQKVFDHSIPKRAKINKPRVSLTFRTIKN